MSYARLSDDSDVYVYKSIYGGWKCCGCILKNESQVFLTLQDLHTHLKEHVAEGHLVPHTTFYRIYQEIEEENNGGLYTYLVCYLCNGGLYREVLTEDVEISSAERLMGIEQSLTRIRNASCQILTFTLMSKQ